MATRMVGCWYTQAAVCVVEPLFYWYFHMQTSLRFTEIGLKETKCPVSKSWVKIKALLRTSSEKSDNYRLKTFPRLLNIGFRCNIKLVKSDLEAKALICPVLYQWSSLGGVMVLGIFSWHTTGSSTPQTILFPLLMTSSSRIMHRVTKLKSFQTDFLNMMRSSQHSDGLYRHQISVQQRTVWMLMNSKLASWCYYVNIYQNFEELP